VWRASARRSAMSEVTCSKESGYSMALV
jgi:hypothetical protein